MSQTHTRQGKPRSRFDDTLRCLALPCLALPRLASPRHSPTCLPLVDACTAPATSIAAAELPSLLPIARGLPVHLLGCLPLRFPSSSFSPGPPSTSTPEPTSSSNSDTLWHALRTPRYHKARHRETLRRHGPRHTATLSWLNCLPLRLRRLRRLPPSFQPPPAARPLLPSLLPSETSCSRCGSFAPAAAAAAVPGTLRTLGTV